MKASTSHRFDLAFPIGMSLILSTVALLLLPGLATVACQFSIGLVLVGLFASRKLLRYARERGANPIDKSPSSKRTVDRVDLLLLIGFAAFYAAISGFLMRAGWPAEAVRGCAFLLLLSVLLLRPRLASRLKKRITEDASLEASLMNRARSQSVHSPDIVNQERIQ